MRNMCSIPSPEQLSTTTISCVTANGLDKKNRSCEHTESDNAIGISHPPAGSGRAVVDGRAIWFRWTGVERGRDGLRNWPTPRHEEPGTDGKRHREGRQLEMEIDEKLQREGEQPDPEPLKNPRMSEARGSGRTVAAVYDRRIQVRPIPAVIDRRYRCVL